MGERPEQVVAEIQARQRGVARPRPTRTRSPSPADLRTGPGGCVQGGTGTIWGPRPLQSTPCQAEAVKEVKASLHWHPGKQGRKGLGPARRPAAAAAAGAAAGHGMVGLKESHR